jgi:hypothetical protein
MPRILPIIDRIAGWLLMIGALLHGYGSYLAYPSLSANLVWAWSGSVAALLLAAINLLRVNRPNDRPLAWISFVGMLVMDRHRRRFCCDFAESNRPAAALSHLHNAHFGSA